jgi:Ca-activated chloride channel family protein
MTRSERGLSRSTIGVLLLTMSWLGCTSYESEEEVSTEYNKLMKAHNDRRAKDNRLAGIDADLAALREDFASLDDEALRLLAASSFGLTGIDEETLLKLLPELRRPPLKNQHGLLARVPVDEELWIIEKPSSAASAGGSSTDDHPGCGALVARLPSRSVEVPVPLRHTAVKGQVSGFVATVDVVQVFENPFDEKIEALYVFPLPHDAAVSEFVMQIGERRIRGIVRKREEAREIYLAARAQGKVASLLTQERPNVFTQAVANIEPGKRIDIQIRYFHALVWADGGYEFVFPMVVGPRFNPPCTTGGIGAAGRGAEGRSGQAAEVSYLRPGERSGHDVELALAIDAGVAIEAIECPSHAVETSCPAPERAEVKLAAGDRIPNRDFVVRFKVAGETLKTRLMVHRGEAGSAFALMLYPPAKIGRLERQPLELVFVLDCSGSMEGEPLAIGKRAIERALKRLTEDDSFQIIRFSDQSTQLGPRPLPASPANVARGLEYLSSLRSEGGTMMLSGIRAALEGPPDAERRRIVSFVTDGYIGNEDEIFAEVGRRLGPARIFSFGVGSSVNRHLLEGLARLGRGAAAFVGLDESAARAADLFYERASRPALTDLSIDWGGAAVADVYPRRVPDLLAGRPVVLSGRFAGPAPAAVRIRGRIGKEERTLEVGIEPERAAAEHPGIAAVWARKRIEVLTDLALAAGPGERGELVGEIERTALAHGLVSARTAFIAVDSLSRTAGDHGTTVPVSVPVPAGVRYETAVGE